MRTLNVVFEDKDYKLLETAKEKKSWRDFLLNLVKGDKK